MTIDDKRCDSRLPVLWSGKITDENNNVHTCDIRDISNGGMMVSCDEQFQIGSSLLLEVENLGEFAGEVRWHSSESLGIFLMAGPHLMLKKFAETAGSDISSKPNSTDDDPLVP